MDHDVSRRLLDAVNAADGHGVEQFLALGADPNLSAGRSQGNVLSLAAASGDQWIVRLLLNGGANIGPSDPYAYSPLRRAIKEGHVDVTRLLLERGALDVETVGPSGVLADAVGALRHAPRPPALEILRMLLAGGARPEPGSGASLVGAVAMRVAPAVLRVLVSAGSDPEQRRRDGMPVLVLAARRGDHTAVDILLQAGADVDAVDTMDRTALMHAVERDEREVVAVLRLAGADIDKVSADGSTARELARGWQRQRVQLLLGERVAGLDDVPIARTVIRARPTGYRLEGDPGTFRLWGRVLEHAVDDLGEDEWEAHTGRSVGDAVELARRLRNEPQLATGASWHIVDVSSDELMIVRAALLELAYGSPGIMPVDVGRDEIVDLFAELDRQTG